METQENSKGFGRLLMQKRLAQGIRLEDIARQSRVSLTCLRFIESEDLDQLPAPVFVRGFLRSYADCIGADADEVIHRYLARLSSHQAQHRRTARMARQAPFGRRFCAALCALAAVIAITLYLAGRDITTGPTGDSAAVPVARDTAGDDTTASPSDIRTSDRQTSILPPTASEPDVKPLLNLKINAVGRTWLKVIADGQPSKAFSLDIGDQLTLKARKRFNLLLGNAAGVTLTLDGRPVPLRGRKDQAVTLQLP